MKYLLLFIATIYSINITYANPPLSEIEKTFDGKIGVYAIDTNNNHTIAYRAEERFPVQSTMKLIGVAALLKNSNQKLLQEKIHYTQHDLSDWSPVTKHYLNNGMSLAALSEAATSFSDNTAMNLILKKFGGPAFATNFAHSIGNKSFNVEHYEGELNSNPNDVHDTSTPKDMALSLQKIVLGNILPAAQREKLVLWMKNNTTSYQRMRSGVAIGWVVADKTGSGQYGIANDIGMVWSPSCKPIIIAIYTAQNKQDAKRRDDIVASTTSAVLDEFAKNDECFKELS